jgi:hypothetical protein
LKNRRRYTGAHTRAEFEDLLHAPWTATQSPRHLRWVDSALHQSPYHAFDGAQRYLFGHNLTSDAIRLLSWYTGPFVRV